MQLAKRKRAEQGLTMIETLMGILVIAAISTALTPALVVAFATRVHNYRVQNAMKIAQGELDRVRLLVEKGEYKDGDWITQLPPFINDQGLINLRLLDYVGKPDRNFNAQPCPLNDAVDQTQRWCTVDINGDNDWDLAVQSFRSPTPGEVEDLSGGQPIAFIMGVRVYTRAALKNNELTSPPKRDTAIAQTSGRQSLKLPLVTRYEVIVRNDLQISRSAYCKLSEEFPGSTGTCN